MTPAQSPDRQFTNSEIKELFSWIGKVDETLVNLSESTKSLDGKTSQLLEAIHNQEKAFIEFRTETKSTIRNKTITWSAIISMLPIAVAVVLHFL